MSKDRLRSTCLTSLPGQTSSFGQSLLDKDNSKSKGNRKKVKGGKWRKGDRHEGKRKDRTELNRGRLLLVFECPLAAGQYGGVTLTWVQEQSQLEVAQVAVDRVKLLRWRCTTPGKEACLPKVADVVVRINGDVVVNTDADTVARYLASHRNGTPLKLVVERNEAKVFAASHGMQIEDEFWRSTELGGPSRRPHAITFLGDNDEEGDDDAEWEAPTAVAGGASGGGGSAGGGSGGGGSGGGGSGGGSSGGGGSGGGGSGGGGSGGGVVAATKRARGPDATDATPAGGTSRGLCRKPTHGSGRCPVGFRVYYGLMCTTVVGRQRYATAAGLVKMVPRQRVRLVLDSSGGKFPDAVAVHGGPADAKLGYVQARGSELLAHLLRLTPHLQCVAEVDGDDSNNYNFDITIEVSDVCGSKGRPPTKQHGYLRLAWSFNMHQCVCVCASGVGQAR
jgi:hypothetical protein